MPPFSRLVRDPRAGYRQSLSVLEHAKKVRSHLVTKSSIMLGCGETDKQVLQTLRGELLPMQAILPSRSTNKTLCLSDPNHKLTS